MGPKAMFCATKTLGGTTAGAAVGGVVGGALSVALGTTDWLGVDEAYGSGAVNAAPEDVEGLPQAASNNGTTRNSSVFRSMIFSFSTA